MRLGLIKNLEKQLGSEELGRRLAYTRLRQEMRFSVTNILGNEEEKIQEDSSEKLPDR